MPEATADNSFEQWCVVELMGYLKLAGLVTETQIGGTSFLRIDVPKPDGATDYTRYFGASAIYSITPVEKEVCLAVAARSNMKPAFAYGLPKQLGGEAVSEAVTCNHANDEIDKDDPDIPW